MCVFSLIDLFFSFGLKTCCKIIIFSPSLSPLSNEIQEEHFLTFYQGLSLLRLNKELASNSRGISPAPSFAKQLVERRSRSLTRRLVEPLPRNRAGVVSVHGGTLPTWLKMRLETLVQHIWLSHQLFAWTRHASPAISAQMLAMHKVWFWKK